MRGTLHADTTSITATVFDDTGVDLYTRTFSLQETSGGEPHAREWLEEKGVPADAVTYYADDDPAD